MSKKKPRPKGYVCPNCDRPLIVTQTRKRASKLIVRRRKCEECNYRETTEERPRVA